MPKNQTRHQLGIHDLTAKGVWFQMQKSVVAID